MNISKIIDMVVCGKRRKTVGTLKTAEMVNYATASHYAAPWAGNMPGRMPNSASFQIWLADHKHHVDFDDYDDSIIEDDDIYIYDFSWPRRL